MPQKQSTDGHGHVNIKSRKGNFKNVILTFLLVVLCAKVGKDNTNGSEKCHTFCVSKNVFNVVGISIQSFSPNLHYNFLNQMFYVLSLMVP